MREPSKRWVLVVWALLLILSQIHSSHAQLHSRMRWKPGGRKRSFTQSTLDNRRQWTQNQRKRLYSLHEDTATMTLIHNIAKTLARTISRKALQSRQQSLDVLSPEWSSGSVPYEDDRQIWRQWEDDF